MYTVGLDEFYNSILYTSFVITKIEKSNSDSDRLNYRYSHSGSDSDSDSDSDSNSYKKDKTNVDKSFNKNEAFEIIFGSLLGDGKMEKAARGVNARFGFTQAEYHRDYFISLLNSLSGICSGKYTESSYRDIRTGKIYKSTSFWSKALPMLNEFYQKFYVDKVKIVPLDLSLLTPLAFAHWVMQDGSLGTSKGLYLCTDSFTHKDVMRLTQYLIKNYNINCSIHKAGKNHRIYISAKSLETVKNIILPFMHKSMLYKLGI